MSNKPLHSFTSHISGKNAKVSIYPDRVEWERSGSYTGAAVKTLGLSVIMPGLRKKDAEMIPVRSITSITSKKGLTNTVVSVIVPGNTIDFRVSHGEAKTVKDTLQRLMLAN
jgi:hypothetical protein